MNLARAPRLAALLALAWLGSFRESEAQLSGSSLIEAQAGNYPDTPPSNRTDLYAQVGVVYALPSLSVGARFELNENSERQFTYRAITQRWAEWNDHGLRVRIGNFETILGRGLLHRSWQLPGVVLDQRGIRSRYGFLRDMDGVIVDGSAGPVEARLFGGRPNGGESSPAAEPFGLQRYEGQLLGGQLAVAPITGTRVGAAYTRATNDAGTRQDEGASGFVEVDPLALAGVRDVALPITVEYATLDRTFSEWWRFDTGEDVPHALYAGANLIRGTFGLSMEWKDYRDFQFGTNDPPSLVREHAILVLNRATHVLQARDETGFQIEASYALPAWGSITANVSRSDGDLGPVDARFEERYLEVHAAPGVAPRWEATVFYDEGRDGFVFVEDREIVGGSATVRVTPVWSATSDLGFERTVLAPATEVRTVVWSIGAARAGWGSAALLWDESRPGEGRFVSGTLQATLTERHEATLTIGNRRGGLACTGGTCYEVPPLEGASLRLTGRF